MTKKKDIDILCKNIDELQIEIQRLKDKLEFQKKMLEEHKHVDGKVVLPASWVRDD